VRFDIQPYTGALPVAFGMRRAEVHKLLGSPESSFPIWDGSGVSESYARSRYNVGYDNTGVVNHIGFSPGAIELTIQGQPIWTPDEQPDPNPVLLALDPDPMEFVGFWFFVVIGVTTTGYHDDDRSQRAVTVFTRGSKAELLERATAADTSRYRPRRGGRAEPVAAPDSAT
jgi:hypothetical protein